MRQSLSHRKMIPQYKDDNATRATRSSCLDLQLWYFMLGSGEEMCQTTRATLSDFILGQ